jgi:hypothetical protein
VSGWLINGSQTYQGLYYFQSLFPVSVFSGVYMSNHTREEEFIPEPDESVLISALRNQDDIPILMDVVGESLVPKISQEGHLSQILAQGLDDVLEIPFEKEELLAASSSASDSVTDPHYYVNENSLKIEPARLQNAIENAFAKLLPRLIDEVVQELASQEVVKKQ